MTETRRVALADVLSVTTPHLLSTRERDGLTDLLNWMTDDSLEFWQLQRAADVCAPALITQHPALEGLAPPPGCSKPALRLWLSQVEKLHGKQLEVARLPEWSHEDPEQELVDRLDLVHLPTADQ
ncbi:hypothetical protein ABZS61_09135 [Streptomyces sp. NPDC005566]|uniref:DUF7736 domain-containing protein n=1 Tax=Streptomyces sp. NPDC005566 TaxID=3156886 RepID=UPI0033A7AE0F